MIGMLRASAAARTLALSVLAVAVAAPAAQAGKSDDTLVWATDREVDVPLPYFNNVRETVIIGRNVWDTLLYRDPETFEYEPLLATAYRWVDNKTLEFDLREGVRFHDGSTFDADDAVKTLNMVADPATGVLTQADVNWIASAEKLGPYKIRLHLKEPFPAALEYLASPVSIMPSEVWDTAKSDAAGKKDYGTIEPIGSGPYKITRMVPGERIEMVKNGDYFDGPKPAATIENLTYRTIADPETQIAELITGGIDWIWDVPLDKAEQLRDMGSITVVNAPTMRVSYLGMDAAGRAGDTPFAKLPVRQAVAHAIDRQAIAENLVGGSSTVIHSACYPSQVGCTQDVPQYEYDPAKAKQLLAEAGYPDGFETDIYAYRQREYTEAAVGYLREVGIKANIKFQQYRALRDIIWEGQTPFVHMTWGSGSVNDVSAITSHFFKFGRDDYCRDEFVKEQLEIGDTSVDPAVRKEAYKNALTRIQEQLCWLPMFTYSKFYAFSDDLAFDPTDDEVPEFYRATWK